ncbi:MAG: hypothetical protein IT381_14910 [Deltaproteobacteria bacterium]|nr:hypothetical protein [Deltaproteobacteria bacterium]
MCTERIHSLRWIAAAALILALHGCRPRQEGDAKYTGKGGASGPTSTTGATGLTGLTAGTGPALTLGECVCVTQPSDLDGDCEPDNVEDTNGNGSYDGGTDFCDLHDPDTDSDGILDGCEDRDHDGAVGSFPPESSPTDDDSDSDGIPDGVEDTNKNGVADLGEASAARMDDDDDGIPDGVEDRNQNGIWDCPEDPLGPPCETKPSALDSDGDGLSDTVELKIYESDPADFAFYGFAGKDGVPGNADDQTYPWKVDSDNDGLSDGIEDKNADGLVGSRETNPRESDSDDDGLKDGIEDINRDGNYDAVTETDPSRIDTDDDGIPDGVEDSGGCLTTNANPPACSGMPNSGTIRCICGFWRDGRRQPFESDPRKRDTDGDGLNDGVEDRNGDGICQLPPARDIPRASDESCAFDNDSDGDLLLDGAEDKNGNGLIDAALDETDARRADPDNDCLLDPFEQTTGTDPFRPDSDEDGLPDGVETDVRLRFDPATQECVPLACGPLPQYLTATCTDPVVRDSDGDGYVDGFETINGVDTGEDENADGCKGPQESNPCVPDAILPPVIGDPTSAVCTLGMDACTARDVRKCDTCAVSVAPANFCGGDGNDCSNDVDACREDAPCKRARKVGQALICAEGNIRPVILVRSEPNDYNVALVAQRGPSGVPIPLYEFGESTYQGTPIGHVFQSLPAAPGPEAIRSVFGGIMRLGTVQLGSPEVIMDDPRVLVVDGTSTGPVAASSGLLPSDLAADAALRLAARLSPVGFLLTRTAGGNVVGHDDEVVTGNPAGTVVRRATDRYLVRRSDGTPVESALVSRLVGSALIGGNNFVNDLALPSAYFKGPVAELRISFYKRLVKERVFTPSGSTLETIAEYGAIWAITALDQNCAALSGDQRADCKERNEIATTPMDDLANGTALSRYQAGVGRGCDPFDPRTAKADFLVVIDDSASMQKNIIAIQQGGRDIAFKLRNNSENLDWRIGMTTSNMGGGRDTPPVQNALLDAYVPYASTSGDDYPKLVPAAPPTDADAFAAYQHTAYDNFGDVQACEYSDTYSPTNPLKSPYCCAFSTNNNMANPLTYLTACCSLPAGTPVPAPYTGGNNFAGGDDFDTGDLNSANFGTNFEGNDTLRCYDFPRFAEVGMAGWGTTVPRYPTSGMNPTQAQRMRHFNDYLCGKVLDSAPLPPFTPPDRGPIELWGTRGFLWPPGFSGVDLQNPRRDGANLLVRNADMLVVQMNRDCTGDELPGSNFVWSPRARNGSGVESMMQAAKRAVERATAPGRTGTRTTLRPDAPLITIFLSDEEDFGTKFRNDTSTRDETPLPPARCSLNGDAGCTSNYCETCFANALDRAAEVAPIASYSIPAARRYIEQGKLLREDKVNGSYCVAPVTPVGDPMPDADVLLQCPAPNGIADTPFCSAGPTSSRRFDGFYTAAYTGNENGASATEQTMGPNRVPPDWLNYTLTGMAATGVNCGCGGDCQPCMRYLRERQYVDFFTGMCSPTDVITPTAPVPNDDPRRYPRPAATLGVGNLVLPLGPVYAITRQQGQQGGSPGACGSTHPGGDGLALRDLALASGGAFANICPAPGMNDPSYADFLEQIIVEAQGIGSPYRLRGAPISSTLRVAVMDKSGKLRLLKRSTQSGFDYNASTNTIAFFAKDAMDLSNQVTQNRDAVVYVSYRVWKRPCENDCAIGDACAICTCSTARPECCTATPRFECQPPSCPTCPPCQVCDFTTSTCRPASACDGSCALCSTTAQGPKCQPCPDHTVAVKMPCVGTQCPVPPLTVCITDQGVTNNGTACAVTADPDDCCGDQKQCATGKICVSFPCSGESCLPTAKCVAPQPSGEPQPCWCGGKCPPDPGDPAPCPIGTICAPIPCQGESCLPRFDCISDNLGSSGTCEAPPECSCPGGVCGDCPVCSFCNASRQCQPLCPPGVSIAECGTDASLRTPALACCPAGETFDPSTGSCVSGGIPCNPACPQDFFCDPNSGRCIPRGG